MKSSICYHLLVISTNNLFQNRKFETDFMKMFEKLCFLLLNFKHSAVIRTDPPTELCSLCIRETVKHTVHHFNMNKQSHDYTLLITDQLVLSDH